jgi:hypothetical protein
MTPSASDVQRIRAQWRYVCERCGQPATQCFFGPFAHNQESALAHERASVVADPPQPSAAQAVGASADVVPGDA